MSDYPKEIYTAVRLDLVEWLEAGPFKNEDESENYYVTVRMASPMEVTFEGLAATRFMEQWRRWTVAPDVTQRIFEAAETVEDE